MTKTQIIAAVAANREKILPTFLMAIDLCAAAPYFADGNWRRGVYWLAAAVLTGVVTW